VNADPLGEFLCCTDVAFHIQYHVTITFSLRQLSGGDMFLLNVDSIGAKKPENGVNNNHRNIQSLLCKSFKLFVMLCMLAPPPVVKYYKPE
jgi:hypothetical protein